MAIEPEELEEDDEDDEDDDEDDDDGDDDDTDAADGVDDDELGGSRVAAAISRLRCCLARYQKAKGTPTTTRYKPK
jgi:TATA-binding protein-associated factor Taf7